MTSSNLKTARQAIRTVMRDGKWTQLEVSRRRIVVYSRQHTWKQGTDNKVHKRGRGVPKLEKLLMNLEVFTVLIGFNA